MGRRTCALLKGKVYTWIELLEKFKIEHVEWASAHIEWDNAYSRNKKLPKVEVMYWDEIENDDERVTVVVKNNSLPIPKAIRDAVWMRDIGPFKNGKCYVCERVITDDLYETGHIEPRSKGGSDDIDNLRAVCIQCNKAMGTRNLEDYKETYHSKMVHRLNQNEVITKDDVVSCLNNLIEGKHLFSNYFEKAIELLEND